MLDIRRIWVFIFFTVVFFEVWVELARAGKIDREKDCGKSKPCLKVYRQEKNAWLECLEQADVPEKKRTVLARKVERLGVRNLKKTEFLIFNSKRKKCHKTFSRAISKLNRGSDDHRKWPAPFDSLGESTPGDVPSK